MYMIIYNKFSLLHFRLPLQIIGDMY